MRLILQGKLAKLFNLLHVMEEDVVSSMDRAFEALISQNTQLARDVMDHDSKINAFKEDIENYCISLIATQQPVAEELREVLSVIKISGVLERIADHAYHFSRALSKIPYCYLEPFLPSFLQMKDYSKSMLSRLLSSYENGEIKNFEKIAGEDTLIDELYNQNHQKICELIKEHSQDIEKISRLFFLNRHLERCGDHMTNIAQWLYHIKTGQHIQFYVSSVPHVKE